MQLRAPHFLALLCALAPGPAAHASEGPCDDPSGWTGDKVCFHDAARKHKASVSRYVKGKEIGPSREWRDDGSLEHVVYLKPNVGSYRTEEDYYETGDLRRVNFLSPDSEVTIHYAVSGRLQRISCRPGISGGYGHSLQECQPKVAFDISAWRPAR